VARRFALPALLIALLGAGIAAAQGTGLSDRAAYILAQREVQEATRAAEALERQAGAARSEAARARAQAAAIAARIQASEADITAAEARLRAVEARRAEQRARLARAQQPVARLTAALQTMARRPPALALVQPGSLDDVVHVRSVLASTLPVIRARTAGVRREIDAAARLRVQAEIAVASLRGSRERLATQRLELARLESRERARSASLAESALLQSDRALAFGEEARELAARIGTRDYQARLGRQLAALPGPALRPPLPGPAQPASRPDGAPAYRLPVEGRLLTGTGELSDAGVHARGLTFATTAGAAVIAPAAGRIIHAGPFRGYRTVVIIDHGGGWMSVLTGLADTPLKPGDPIEAGAPVAQAAGPEISVELRQSGRPFAITSLL
jgi:murein hydrolase activator